MTALPASVPHAGAVELDRWRLDSYRGLRKLRAALHEALVDLAAARRGDVADRIAVVATELATNALRHGLPPTEVRLLYAGDHLVIDVADRDLEEVPRFDLERPPGRGGLGLLLARTFAADVGWYKTDKAKHVWASFPV